MAQGALNLMSQVAMELHGTLVGQALFTKGIATQAFNLFNLAHKARPPVFVPFPFAPSDQLPPGPFSLSPFPPLVQLVPVLRVRATES